MLNWHYIDTDLYNTGCRYRLKVSHKLEISATLSEGSPLGSDWLFFINIVMWQAAQHIQEEDKNGE